MPEFSSLFSPTSLFPLIQNIPKDLKTNSPTKQKTFMNTEVTKYNFYPYICKNKVTNIIQYYHKNKRILDYFLFKQNFIMKPNSEMRVPITPDMRKRLKVILGERKITGYAIKKNLKISASTLSNYLNPKKKNADLSKLTTICDFLGITVEWLRFGGNLIGETAQAGKEATETEEKQTIEFLLKEIYADTLRKNDLIQTLHKDIRSIQEDMKILKQELKKNKKA